MGPDLRGAVLTLLATLLSQGSVCGQLSPSGDHNLLSTLIVRMDDIQRQLADVTNAMRDLEDDIGKTIFKCLGVHSDLCEALGGWVKSPGDVSSGWVPENLSSPSDPQLDRHKSVFRELGRKKEMINHLLGVFKGANNVLKNERKRTCKLNLGFHCQTEEISNFADIYDYLSSARSPGKKR